MGKAVAGTRVCVGCRVTVLSRYNPDSLCGPCARIAREVSGVVPVWVWDSAPLRAAGVGVVVAGSGCAGGRGLVGGSDVAD